MRWPRFWISVWGLVALCALPTPASAGIVDLIIEMSGPQMLGVLVQCKVRTDGTFDTCDLVGKRVPKTSGQSPSRLELSLEGGVYFSTGRNTNGRDYEFGKIWMLAFDPLVEIRSVGTGRREDGFTMYHGVIGATFNGLFGSDIDSFTNVGFKLRPIGVKMGRVDVAYNLRLYPTRFRAEQFGKRPERGLADGTEPVHSVSVGFSW